MILISVRTLFSHSIFTFFWHCVRVEKQKWLKLLGRFDTTFWVRSPPHVGHLKVVH